MAMKQRTLTRKTLIREYDFNKVKAQAFAPLSTMGIIETLYDRATFMPLDQVALEKIKMLDILKGKKSTPLIEAEWNLKMPAVLVFHLRDYLYNEKYWQWKVSIDEEGFLCVQARRNTPKSRLGWGVFEKDLTSRL